MDYKSEGRRLQREFGQRVKSYRRQRGLSQQQLAENIGLSLNMIGSMERGIKFTSPEILCRLSENLEVKVAELFGGYKDEESLTETIGMLYEAYYVLPFLVSKPLKTGVYTKVMERSQAYADNDRYISRLREKLKEQYKKVCR